jgi:hypothetical protein
MRVLAGECVTRERCVRSSYGGAEAGISRETAARERLRSPLRRICETLPAAGANVE